MVDNEIVNQLIELVKSPYIWAALIAYLSGQLLKIILELRKQHPLTFRDFFASGNMPSTHTASVCAMTTVVGMLQGFDSPLFAVALMMTMIVGYDAAHVRRAVGEHGLILRELIDRDNDQEHLLAKLTEELNERGDSKAKKEKAKGKLAKPYFSRGHLPREVFAGAVLGILIGVIVSLIVVS